MLSIFPTLLAYQEVAPLLLRLTLGIVFGFWAYRTFKAHTVSKMRALAVADALITILLIVGLFVQVAALAAAAMLVVGIVRKVKKGSFFTNGVNYYFILLVIALSLLVTGPGMYAFDLPL